MVENIRGICDKSNPGILIHPPLCITTYTVRAQLFFTRVKRVANKDTLIVRDPVSFCETFLSNWNAQWLMSVQLCLVACIAGTHCPSEGPPKHWEMPSLEGIRPPRVQQPSPKSNQETQDLYQSHFACVTLIYCIQLKIPALQITR